MRSSSRRGDGKVHVGAAAHQLTHRDPGRRHGDRHQTGIHSAPVRTVPPGGCLDDARYGGLGLDSPSSRASSSFTAALCRSRRREGKGTTVTVVLPLTAVQQHSDAAERAHPRTERFAVAQSPSMSERQDSKFWWSTISATRGISSSGCSKIAAPGVFRWARPRRRLRCLPRAP